MQPFEEAVNSIQILSQSVILGLRFEIDWGQTNGCSEWAPNQKVGCAQGKRPCENGIVGAMIGNTIVGPVLIELEGLYVSDSNQSTC